MCEDDYEYYEYCSKCIHCQLLGRIKIWKREINKKINKIICGIKGHIEVKTESIEIPNHQIILKYTCSRCGEYIHRYDDGSLVSDETLHSIYGYFIYGYLMYISMNGSADIYSLLPKRPWNSSIDGSEYLLES